MKMEQNRCQKIQEFVEKRIKQVKIKQEQTSDIMEKLKLAITEVSFAHILSQFFKNQAYSFQALLNLSRAYISTQNYQQALVQARLAKKQSDTLKDQQAYRTTLLMAECKIKQNKFQDAFAILQDFDISIAAKEGKRTYYQLLLTTLVELAEERKMYQVLREFQEFTELNYGDQTTEKGFYLIKRGKSLGKFEKYEEALTNLKEAIDILIANKCKDKNLVASVYLTMSDYYKKQGNLEKQHSSLICAQSMTRQLEQPEKATLPIIHMLATNSIERGEPQQALKQLRKAKDLQKQLYGQSSSQIAKTTKKILQLLHSLNMKSQAKKCEQEYSRILGTSGASLTLKQKTNQPELKHYA